MLCKHAMKIDEGNVICQLVKHAGVMHGISFCSIATCCSDHWEDPETLETGRVYDEVLRPSHYCVNGLEAKEVLSTLMKGSGVSGIKAFWWGNAFKYLWRWPRKNKLKDLKKCRECLDNLIKALEEDE